MGRIIDETGNRYGRLTVVRRNPENAYHKGANWICRCECGGERVASGIGLRQGLIKSCGCLIRETRVLRCACGYKGQKTRDWTPDWKCYRCSGLSPLQEPPKMTEDEIFEKRVEHWRYYHRSAPTSASHDVMLFLERLEKVTKERDEARERNTDLRTMLEQVTRDRDHVEESLVRLEAQRDEARAEVDAAYLERNQLVALLSKVFPAGLKRTEIPGWIPEWHGCVFVDFPWGQASWHYHERDAALFAHLGTYTGKWDGHTTEEKYKAIAAAQVASYADLRAEVERLHLDVGCLQLGLTVTSEAYRAGFTAGSRAAFRRGAEAMREACVREVHGFLVTCFDVPRIEAAVRALPIPEDK